MSQAVNRNLAASREGRRQVSRPLRGALAGRVRSGRGGRKFAEPFEGIGISARNVQLTHLGAHNYKSFIRRILGCPNPATALGLTLRLR